MSKDVYSSIVADGYHVNFEMVRLAKNLMGERLFLITDAVAENNGVYPHLLKEDRYVLPDGTLSGSALTMIKAVKNCIEKAGISPCEAFRMASTYPAKAIGLELGTFQTGTNADCLIINKELEIKTIIKNGEIINRAL
jgi:N-acetylglucosamine-6-phosphate deacetylase